MPKAVPKTVKRLAQSTRAVGKTARKLPRKLRSRLPRSHPKEGRARAPRSPEPIATGSDELAEQRRQVLAEAAGQEGDAETVPDVLLDVPMLKVDKIGLDVDELRARVSLRSNLGDLINIEVGADVGIGRVSMTIEGVEAQAMLKARLERVFQIFNRALDTVDKHPEVLTSVMRPVGEAARGALEKGGFFEASAGSEATEGARSEGEDRLVTDAGLIDEEGRSGE